MGKEYKLLESRTVNDLLKELQDHGSEGWGVVTSIQEYGVTKLILEREKQ